MSLRTKIILALTLLGPLSAHSFDFTVTGNNTLNYYGSASGVGTYNTATLNVGAGSFLNFAEAYDSSTINVNPNTYIQHLTGSDSSTINVNGGSIYWLSTLNNSHANVVNGNINDLVVYDTSRVDIYGSNFNYVAGHLSGKWSTGESFNFWALTSIQNQTATYSNILPQNIYLHAVPLPPTAWLFSSGLLGVLGLARRRR